MTTLCFHALTLVPSLSAATFSGLLVFLRPFHSAPAVFFTLLLLFLLLLSALFFLSVTPALEKAFREMVHSFALSGLFYLGSVWCRRVDEVALWAPHKMINQQCVLVKCPNVVCSCIFCVPSLECFGLYIKTAIKIIVALSPCTICICASGLR